MYLNNQFPANLISLQGLRVLVIDNHVDSSDLIALLLQPYGVEVKTAFLAQQAQKLLQWQPDVLVSEIALPEEDGFALIQHVRTLAGRWGERVPIIALTSYVTEEMRQRALSCGFDHWLTKPLDLDAFIALLVGLAIRQPLSSAIGLAPTCQIAQQLLDQILYSSHVLCGVT